MNEDNKKIVNLTVVNDDDKKLGVSFPIYDGNTSFQDFKQKEGNETKTLKDYIKWIGGQAGGSNVIAVSCEVEAPEVFGTPKYVLNVEDAIELTEGENLNLKVTVSKPDRSAIVTAEALKELTKINIEPYGQAILISKTDDDLPETVTEFPIVITTRMSKIVATKIDSDGYARFGYFIATNLNNGDYLFKLTFKIKPSMLLLDDLSDKVITLGRVNKNIKLNVKDLKTDATAVIEFEHSGLFNLLYIYDGQTADAFNTKFGYINPYGDGTIYRLIKDKNSIDNYDGKMPIVLTGEDEEGAVATVAIPVNYEFGKETGITDIVLGDVKDNMNVDLFDFSKTTFKVIDKDGNPVEGCALDDENPNKGEFNVDTTGADGMVEFTPATLDLPIDAETGTAFTVNRKLVVGGIRVDVPYQCKTLISIKNIKAVSLNGADLTYQFEVDGIDSLPSTLNKDNVFLNNVKLSEINGPVTLTYYCQSEELKAGVVEETIKCENRNSGALYYNREIHRFKIDLSTLN